MEKKHDLREILHQTQYKTIHSTPRIMVPDGCNLKDNTWSNLVDLEHKALTRQLFIGNQPANVWWKNCPQWCGEVQRQQRFRDSPIDEAYYLWVTSEYSRPKWLWKNENVRPAKFGDLSGISIENIELGSYGIGNDFWFDLGAKSIYAQLANELTIDTIEEISRRFGEVRLVEYEDCPQEYKYHSNLGVFQEIRERV